MLLNKNLHNIFRINIILLICYGLCFSSASAEGTNTTNDSLLNLYINSNNDSININALVLLAANMESNSVLIYKDKTADDYIELANLKTSDSSSNYNLIRQLDMIAVKFRNNGKYVSALKFHNWAKDISSQINNKNQQSIIYNNIGVVYRRLDDYQTALTNHIKALKLAEETNNLKSQAVAINSIGNIQMMIGNTDESLKYFKQSLILEQKQNSLLGIAINLNNIGNVYSRKDNLKKSLEYYFLSLDINKEINSKRGIAICYNDIGNIYKRKGDFSKALKYYLYSFSINFELNDKHNLADSYIQVGELYIDQGQDDKAIEYLLPGLEISLKIGSKALIMSSYYKLYVINEKKENYKKAIYYLKLSNQYHDSITNINVKKDIARLQIKFESERKESQIELLKQNARISELAIKRQKTLSWLTLSAFIIALGFVISLSYYLFSKNKTNKLLLDRNKVIEKTKAELDDYSKQLLKAKQEAENSNRAKGEFLANMSHEIRTPLNSVIGFAELLSKSASDPVQLNHLKIIKSSSRTLLTLLNDILDLSKIEAGKFTIEYENINIEQIIYDVTQMFSQRALEKNIELITNIQFELPQSIYLSELRLRQILFNLIGNAINFTVNGSITINAYSKPCKTDNTTDLFISIRDTGIGIHEHELQSIFEPFSQSETNKTKKGTGLGLAITKRLVEMMGGSIRTESTLDEGTIFSIHFPEVKLITDISNSKNKINQIIYISESVKPLLYIKNISECKLLGIEGFKNYLNENITTLYDAKKFVKDKNLVLICGFSNEESINTLKVLKDVKSNKKVYFIIINNNKPKETKNISNVIWISNLVSSNKLASTINQAINKIALKEESDFYFNDLAKKNTNPLFEKDINEIYNKYFKQAYETKLLSNITTFRNMLSKVADKHNNNGLQSYCTELNTKIQNFEINKIEKLLNLFNSNFPRRY